MTRPVIEVEDLVRRFGSLEAVRGVSFEVREGEIFGFLGPNGAGKSTTINILATLLRPTSGRALLAGHDVVREPVAVRRAIGLVFQDPTLDIRLTAQENLYIHGMLYGVTGARLRERIDQVLRMVGLEDRRHSIVRTFSGGMKRRLEIARGFLHRPRVLFLDEPTVGLDPQTRAAIWEHVHRLRDQEGVTVFMTTHYMDEAEHCDRIAIIDHGRIVALDTPAALKRQVGGEVIVLRTEDGAALSEAIERRFGIRPQPDPEGLRLEVPDAAALLPRLAAAYDRQIRGLLVHEPTLDDVFLKLTGRAIRDEEGGAADAMRHRHRARMWHGR
ncbi:ATP-binding cassette domain-containing protein [Caldinitratiruptor microaerophilus]|uniref:Daunorubicin resistance protein DrrA family ABC transporter ATP-binding protein n=1 Tax=Caldinitratiruptor microaerophilus TaxID=671077 RepID=A0AA35CPR9_9FIRM|nr:ATP-binding cassette domain-containing protein [Caldinitratiruptor microaerophilus]BDG61600.1 daunorubicin resistance protein DrrA family ABC transporter ATP-binding protein [Caldinitratiruptor microaerophilus]